MDLSRLAFGARITKAAIAAVALLAIFEALALWGFHESARDRNAFGYERDTSFAIDGKDVLIETAASRRFWPQRYAIAKPADAIRIVAIGDSVFRGASLRESMTDALQRHLSAACGMPAEVWNLSSPGYGSGRKAIVLEKALEFHPDLVIYHAGITTEYEDSRERARYADYHSSHPRHWVDQLPFLGRLKLSKLERLYWNWLPDDVRSADDRPEQRGIALKEKLDRARWTPRMLPNLDRAVDSARQAGVPMVILVHTLFDPATGRLDDLGLDAVLAQRYSGIPSVRVISNREMFAREADVQRLFYDLSHWTTAGYERVAAGMTPTAVAMLTTRGSCAQPMARRIVNRPGR